MKTIKFPVFLPPFLLLLGAVILNLVDQETFNTVSTIAFLWVRDTFARLFDLAATIMVVICAVIALSPFGRVTIGGPRAKPFLTKWRLFSISLCTGIGVGILLFGAGEPISHLAAPPESSGLSPSSYQAGLFAMSSVYRHWTLVPYAMYSAAGLMFAFAYYNMGLPFSLGSTLWPILGDRCRGAVGHAIDAVCLYALVAGLAGSLGGGLMLLCGGFRHLLGIEENAVLLPIILITIVATYTISAVSGVMKGIRLFSALNTVIFIGLMVFVLLAGPTRFILAFGIESFGHFLKDFFRASLLCVTTVPDTWTKDWTIFYWAWWFAWTPMVAVFIGRISYGYTVRQFLVFNLLLPALFGAVWMAVFGGAAIHMELYENAGLVQALEQTGTEGVMYALLSHLPLTRFMVPLFLFTVFLSFVTAADSNTSAMSSLSSTGISPEHPEPSAMIKVIWGVMAGAITWIMVSSAGLDGLRMISNLGGLPAMLLCLMIAVALIKVVLSPAKYDRFKDGYTPSGRPKRR